MRRGSPLLQSNFLCNPQGTEIVAVDLRNDLRELQHLEGVDQNGSCGFRGQSLPPEPLAKPPANLDVRSDCVDGNQEHPSDENGRLLSQHDRPVAHAWQPRAGRPILDEFPVGGWVGPWTADIAGDLRFTIHGKAIIGVGQRTRTEQESFGLEGDAGIGAGNDHVVRHPAVRFRTLAARVDSVTSPSLIVRPPLACHCELPHGKAGAMTTTDQTIEITALSERPHFREAVSDRIWKAWWRDEGYLLEQIDDRVRQSLGPEIIPAALVAAAGERFLGTVSLIDNDMDERPGFSPWIAARWVDPAHRRRGVGAALVRAAAARAFEAGFPTVYLCATPDNTPFYFPLGWQQIEANVAGLNILSHSR